MASVRCPRAPFVPGFSAVGHFRQYVVFNGSRWSLYVSRGQEVGSRLSIVESSVSWSMLPVTDSSGTGARSLM